MLSVPKPGRACVVLAFLSCSGEATPVDPPPPPETATLSIVINTQGPEPDADGYTIEVAGQTHQLGVIDSITLTDIAPGEHLVELSGKDLNCHFLGGNNIRMIRLEMSRTSRVGFDLDCKAALRNKIFFISDREGQRDIYAMNPDGNDIVRLTDWPSEENSVDVSPDRTKMVFASNRAAGPGSGVADIWVMDFDGGDPLNLTQSQAFHASTPSWSPDGQKIVYQAGSFERTEIWVMNADGGGKTRLTFNSVTDGLAAWSPSGNQVAFNRDRGGGFLDLFIMDSDGTNERFVTSDMFGPDWSPDGSFLVASGTTGSPLGNEIFLINMNDFEITDISNAEGLDWFPKWSPDGLQVTYTALRTPALAFDVFTMNADGSNQQRITTFEGFDAASSWSNP